MSGQDVNALLNRVINAIPGEEGWLDATPHALNRIKCGGVMPDAWAGWLRVHGFYPSGVEIDAHWPDKGVTRYRWAGAPLERCRTWQRRSCREMEVAPALHGGGEPSQCGAGPVAAAVASLRRTEEALSAARERVAQAREALEALL